MTLGKLCRTEWLLVLLGLCLGTALRAAEGPVFITRQPTNLTVLLGDAARFDVEVDGTAPFTYQWLRNGQPLALATNESFTIEETATNDHGAVLAVWVTNALGTALSSNALLRIDPGIIGNTQTVSLVVMSNAWKYEASGNDLGTQWRAVGYNDSGWSNGLGVFDGKAGTNRVSVAGEIIRTRLPLTNASGAPIITHYFRTHFTFTNTPAVDIRLRARTLIDDGAILYLNGQELYRFYVNSGAASTNFATRNQSGDARIEGPVDLPITNLVVGDNLLAVEVHQTSATNNNDVDMGLLLEALLAFRLPDTLAPVVAGLNPVPSTYVQTLSQIEVTFNEPVQGVDAPDLLINEVPAANVLAYSPSQYVFQFATPATGVVQVSWSPENGIRDMAVNPNAFVPSNWLYVLDPEGAPPTVVINEFMARNSSNARDEDGEFSDWIELYNAGSSLVNLAGWYLTESPTNLTQWRFPSVSIAPNTYLLVWASGKDKTNAAAPLHTNFQLDGDGQYLGLVSPNLGVVSQFAPAYPGQYPDVSYGRDRLNPTLTGYFLVSTTNAPNSTSGTGFAPEVTFSRRSSTFLQPFTLELSTPSPRAEIRYVLVTDAASAALTNVPTQFSPLYTNALSIIGATQVRARAFQVGSFLPGPPRSETYIPIEASAATNSSDLPLVLIYNFGAGAVPATYDQTGVIMVFEPTRGRSSLTNQPKVSGRIGFNLRGSSTQGMAKSSFSVEFWDEYNEDRDVELLDMPAESDWVFYGPNSFEPVLIHNAYAHGVSRAIDRYSPRTRFVELYLNTTGGAITASTPASGNYNGIYIVEEKIKVANGRVDLDKMAPQQTNEPAVTGGYLMKIDRVDSDERTFTAAGTNIVYQYPDGLEMASSLRAAQATYLRNYFNTFYAALTNQHWTNPVTGYRAYIDVESWLDHHLLNNLMFCVDALRLSAYFYKPRNQGINMGPLWDFDRALGSTDGRDFNPRLWRSKSGDLGTDMFNPSPLFWNPWYAKMFKDIDFWQQYIDRWQMLRQGALSTASLQAMVDSMAGEIAESQTRERIRWLGFNGPRSGTVSDGAGSGYSYTFPGTYQGEVDFLKKWLADRAEFMDTNFLAKPRLNFNGGSIASGFTLVMGSPMTPPGSTIYYTMDGSDPRAPNSGGQVAANAFVYTGPILLMNNAQVVARAFNPNHSNLTGSNNPPISSPWSGPARGMFVVSTPALRITEIMYHPADPAAGNTNDAEGFEYLEIQNIGATPLDVANFRISGGLDFVFPSLVLTGGQSAVIVANTAVFQSRYGTDILIAGEFTNRLDNGGERLVLTGPLGEPILDFAYDDQWHPITDGFGFSLVIGDPNAPVDSWNFKQSWRPSARLNGSPGVSEPLPSSFPQVLINEILTHTDLPAVDAVELYNAGTALADISHWYLTDDFREPKKYRFPSPTLIPGHRFLVLSETNFNTGPQAFSFSSRGEEVYLFSADTNGNLTGYVQGFDFGAAAAGVTLGRYVTSTGEEHYPRQSTPTLGAANSAPRVGPLVISEVMYHPRDTVAAQRVYDNTEDEYIELYNVSDSPVALYHPTARTNTWHLRDAVDYVFPSNVVVAPHSYMLVVAFDPNDSLLWNSFCARFGVPMNTPVFGPFKGKLQNDEESVELAQPDEVAGPGSVGISTSYVLVDKVKYSDAPPWPVGSDGTGCSLQRINLAGYGNDPINWLAARPSPGAECGPLATPVITMQPASQAVRAGSVATFLVNATGSGTLQYQWRRNGTNLLGATNSLLVLTNLTTAQAGTYQCVVMGPNNSILSSAATLTVQLAPVIIVSPQSQTAFGSTNAENYGVVPSNIVFSTVLNGSLPFCFQWLFNGSPLPGQTNAALVLSNATSLDDGVYSVIVSNLVGCITSTPASLKLIVSPKFVEQPQSQTSILGATITFRARVQGNPPPFGYCWQRDGLTLTNLVSHQTSSTFTISGVKSSDAGLYTVTVTNAANPFGITSAAARLEVIGPPVIITPPVDQSVVQGSNATFSVTAVGTALSYQWRFGYSPIAGQTNAVLVLTNVQLSQEGTYRVTVSNPAGATTSQAALSVVVRPVLSVAPYVSNGVFQAYVTGRSNRGYRIEYSTNFLDWTTFMTLFSTNEQASFTDSVSTNKVRRFYRARLTP